MAAATPSKTVSPEMQQFIRQEEARAQLQQTVAMLTQASGMHATSSFLSCCQDFCYGRALEALALCRAELLMVLPGVLGQVHNRHARNVSELQRTSVP
jgi:hypothetical protein